MGYKYHGSPQLRCYENQHPSSSHLRFILARTQPHYSILTSIIKANNSRMAPSRAQLIETATALVRAFETCEVEDVLAKRSAKSTQHLLPESLGRPALDLDGFRQHIQRIKQLIPNGFRVTFNKEPIVDEAARKVVVFAKTSAETISGPYHNEYVFIIHLNEEGTLADKVEEYLDSWLVKELESRLDVFKKQSSS